MLGVTNVPPVFDREFGTGIKERNIRERNIVAPKGCP